MSQPIDDLGAQFAQPPDGSAPMMRWWWFGPSIDRAEIDRELTAMAAAGLGGAEVAYVYPLEPATSPFGSREFLAHVRFAAERARELRLRLDLTLGSGWSFGGPHITSELAARRLHWEHREIHPGPLDLPVVSPFPGDELIAAYVGAQEGPDRLEPLPIIGEMIRVPDGDGVRQVLLAYAQRTGQNVKRAAVGAEGPVLDHYSLEATKAHLRAVGDPLLDAVPAGLIGSVFCDSLEVYESDWTPNLPAEFERRNGYPLLPELYLMAVDGPDADRVRADYHRTLVELYQENFAAAIQQWANGRGVPFRIQGYGTPPATVSSYRFADRIEGEGWGWKEITQTRWASSAAHRYGQVVTSAEAWTWVHSPSFRATPLDLLGEAHEHLLNGVNLLVGHGWPYSPHDAPGLGWFFYASGALDDRNPWWPAMPSLTAYLKRLCWLLQQGESVADVAVYVPNEDLFTVMGRAQGGSLDTWREAARRIPRIVASTIRTSGLDYDLIDDDAIALTDPVHTPVVVVPVTSILPAASRAWLERVIDAGGRVIMVDCTTTTVPGATAVHSADFAESLAAAIDPDVRLEPNTGDIGCVHRRVDGADIYFVANTGPRVRTFAVTARTPSGHWQEWDPATGLACRVGATADGTDITLHPYQATVLIMTSDAAATVTAGRDSSYRVELAAPWQAAFGDESPKSVDLPHCWEEQPGRAGFSGAVTYRTTVEVAAPSRHAVLNFGAGSAETADDGSEVGIRGHSYRVAYLPPVREVAEVRVNGVDCGVAWAPPYQVEVSAGLTTGTNEIEIVVHNTASNALAHEENIGRLVEAAEQRYGRRFRMQELDKAMDGVRSGLLATPWLELAD